MPILEREVMPENKIGGLSNNIMLEIKEIDVSYGLVRVLSQISMNVIRSGITCIIGPNGAGKSTVLKAIMNLVSPLQGMIIFDGVDITCWMTHRIVESRLAYIPQGRTVFRDMTIQENLDLGAYTKQHDKSFLKNSFERVYEMFPLLHERRNVLAGKLSGGEQQMLAIARVFMINPKLVLLDEPSLGLAPILVDKIFTTIKKLKETGTTFLIVEQNAAMALEISDQGYVLELGKNRMEGTGAELLKRQDVRKLYLGL